MKVHEYREMMSYLTRPAQLATTRENFGEGTKLKLENFVKNFIEQKGRPPTIMEVAGGSKSSTASIKKYLKEGADYTKTDLSEVGKKGGDVSGSKKKTGITKVSDKLVKDFKDLKIKGVSPAVETTKAGSKSFRIKFDKKLGLKDIFVPATEENLNNLKNQIADVIDSDNYKENIKPFQTDAERLAANRFKQSLYRKQDPFRIYETLQEYKTKKFPDLSYDENIQHGQSKFSTQTLSRFGLLPREYNVKGPIKKIERIRDNYLKTTLATLDNPNATAAAKKAAAEKYNSIVKGLRGQLKGTPVQGYVNFETFEVDNKGNYKKVKDIGFDPKKGMAFGDELGDLDLSKITREQADEIIALGKKKIDLDLLQKTIPNLTTADQAPTPDKVKTRNMFKDFEIRSKQSGPELDANRALLRGLGEAVKFVPTPAGTLALNVGLRTDPTQTLDRVGLGIEAATLPSIFKFGNRITAGNPMIQKFFNLGMTPANAMRLARFAQPIGVASLAGEGLYRGAKYMIDRNKMLQSLTDEQRDELLAREKQEAVGQMRRGDAEAFDYIGAADGGRIGFADGPEDPSKRKFMKIMGGLASLPVLGKFFKIAEPLAPAVSKAAESVPPYFLNLVEKIRALGKSFPGPVDRSESFKYKDYDMDVYYDTGSIDIKKTREAMIPGGDEAGVAEEVYMSYRPGMADETTKGLKPADEYEEFTARPDREGKMKDVEGGVPDEVIDEGSTSKEELEQLIIENIKKGE